MPSIWSMRRSVMTSSGPEAAGGGQCQRRAFHGFDFVVFRAQADGQQAQQARIVIDDQDAGFALGGMGRGELHGG